MHSRYVPRRLTQDVAAGLRRFPAVGVSEAWVVAPVRESYPIAEGVTVAPLAELLTALR